MERTFRLCLHVAVTVMRMDQLGPVDGLDVTLSPSDCQCLVDSASAKKSISPGTWRMQISSDRDKRLQFTWVFLLNTNDPVYF